MNPIAKILTFTSTGINAIKMDNITMRKLTTVKSHMLRSLSHGNATMIPEHTHQDGASLIS